MVNFLKANSFLPKCCIKLVTAVIASCAVTNLFAAGFQIQEQNVAYLGTAYTGTAAIASDASTAFYNAAGLTKIKNKQIVLSGVLIQADTNLTVISSSNSFGGAVVGDNHENAGGLHPVPSIYFASRINDEWVFGFSIASPFGLKSEYEEDSMARYVATLSELRSVAFSPSLAWEANKYLSLAAGVDIVYAEAQLDAQIGTGNVLYDGFQKNHGVAWGNGWHAGIMINATDNLVLGINYRSRVNIKAEGESEQLTINDPAYAAFVPALFPGLGMYTTRIVRTNLTMPDSIVGSFKFDALSCLSLVGDIHWTKWSRFHTLRLRFDPLGRDTDTQEHFKDTLRFGLGLIYKYNDRYTFRTGFSHDGTPVVTDHRTARIPDTDRKWLGFGAGIKLTNKLHMDLGYSHLFFKDAELIDEGPLLANTFMTAGKAKLEGEYDSYANIFGIQIRYDFV